MKFKKSDLGLLIILIVVFWLGVLHDINLPGLYMDAVNPDYLAVQTLHPKIHNPSWIMPTATFPILGGFSHGMQNYYVDLIIFYLFGTSVGTLHVSQSLFGAALLILSFLISLRVTENRTVSFLTCAALATEIAFISSFKSQFYIILGGETWLFISLLFLFNPQARFFWSGVSFGLSAYAHLVMFLFLPGFFLLVLSRSHKGLSCWIIGAAFGFLPYILGYASLIFALGGLHPAEIWLVSTTSELLQKSSNLSFLSAVHRTILFSSLALNNAGNELMLFRHTLDHTWGNIKIGVFIVTNAWTLIRAKRDPASRIAVLCSSYLFAMIFIVGKLWVQEFSVLIPLMYLVLAISVAQLLKARRIQMQLIYVSYSIFLAANLFQDAQFWQELERTGGVGKASNAIDHLSNDALHHKETIYVFPEWGFFMPFDLLTGNGVRYVMSVNDLRAYYGSRVALAFWSFADLPIYRSELEQIGVEDLQMQPYYQRDRRPAFYVLNGYYPKPLRYKLVEHAVLAYNVSFDVQLPQNCETFIPSNIMAEVDWDVAYTGTKHIEILVGHSYSDASVFSYGKIYGALETGNWVSAGLMFFLVDQRNDELLGTVQITSQECS